MGNELQSQCSLLIASARAKSLTIATTESCTAGSFAKQLGETPGAGGVFLGGFVSYDKAFKSDVLRVPEEVIQRETAVSAIVAAGMANGALELTNANMAAAITGVAGPRPDEDGNPVGLVYIAVRGSRGQRLDAQLTLGDVGPDVVCIGAISRALRMLEQMANFWDEQAVKASAHI